MINQSSSTGTSVAPQQRSFLESQVIINSLKDRNLTGNPKSLCNPLNIPGMNGWHGEGMLAGSETLWFELFLGCVYLAHSSEALAVPIWEWKFHGWAERWEGGGSICWYLELILHLHRASGGV